MSWRSAFPSGLAVVWGFFLAGTAWAEETDKKEEKKPEPPTVILSLPLAVSPGKHHTVLLRGLQLTNVTELKFIPPHPELAVELKSKEKAEIPKPLEAKQAGNTQLDVRLWIPSELTTNVLAYVAVSPDGESGTNTLLVIASDKLLPEKESNGGFRNAQPINLGDVVSGAIQIEKDVDVFRFQGMAGQRISAEIRAARYGSALDAIITLYDQLGQPIATADDGQGRDATLAFTLPANGAYYLSVIDAHDRGSVVHVYLLEVE